MTDTTPESGSRTAPANPRRWAGLAVLASSLLIVVMDMTILNVAIPSLAADLQPTSVELLWIVDVYSLVIAGLLVTVSALGDRWGRRHMLVAGYLLFGAASVLVLIVPDAQWLIAIRALLGVGGAMIMPSTLSMIRSLFPDPRERATALGIWGATAGVGAAVGPIVGGALLEVFSWHAAFLVNVPLMLAAAVLALRLLPVARSDDPAPLDPVATILSVVGMAALVYAIKEIGKDGFTAAGTIAAVVAVAGLFAFALRCLRRRDPLLDLQLFRNRSFSAGVLTALMASIAMAAVMLLAAQWLQLVHDFSPIETGLALLPAAVAGGILSPIAPSIAARIGTRAVLAGGLAVGGAGYLVIGLAPTLSYPIAAVGFALIGASMGSLAIASAVIMAGSPVERAGNAAAIEETSYEVGGALGVAVLGSIAAAAYRSDLPAEQLVSQGLPAELVPVTHESLAGAMEIADQAGPAGTALADAAQAAFTNGFGLAAVIGGVLLAASGVVVFLLTPRSLDVTGGH